MSEYDMLLKWRFRVNVGALSNTSLKISLPVVPLQSLKYCERFMETVKVNYKLKMHIHANWQIAAEVSWQIRQRYVFHCTFSIH
jgi:hypothetical protein